MTLIEIRIYAKSAEKKPFLDWLRKLDSKWRYQVRMRLDRISAGHLGDCKPVSGAKGVFELRLHQGPGYRVYFAKEGKAIVLLLCAGDKSTQKKDIELASKFWEDYRSEGQK